MTREEENSDLRRDLDRLMGGEIGTYTQIYERLYSPLFRYALSKLRSRELATDLTQDVFMRVFEKIKAGQVKEISKSYFFRSIQNSIIDHWRSKDRLVIRDEELIAKEADRSGESMKTENTGLLRAIKEELGKLKDAEREAIELRYFGELEIEEIADVMGKSEVAIRQLCSRGIKKIRENKSSIEKYL
jgi:RNA polymerase sigma-70 factor (ECF subfamily)